MTGVKKSAKILFLISLYSFIFLPSSSLWAQSERILLPVNSFSVLLPGEGQGLFTRKAFSIQQLPFSLKTKLPSEKSWYKKWWVWAVAASIVAGIASSTGGGGSSSQSAGASPGFARVSGPVP
ncbi:MAG: hypothetical protein ACE5FY_05360 [Nitrospiria bacterium]